jgi:N-acetylglutamate synthase-like GNAT family acetyltransferase
VKPVLRSARREDLEAACSLIEACGLSAAGVEDQFAGAYVIAESKGELVGVAGMEAHGSHGLLRSLAVKESARNAGLGLAMLRDRLTWARERELESVHLLTTTADVFFSRYGFVAVDRATAPAEIRRSREFSEMCPDTAIFMEFTKGGA